MIRYSPSHEWIHIEKNEATVGITAHAQKELGEIVHIELPKIGARLKFGEETAVLESTKAAADVYAPVSGEITEINEELKKNPALLNHTPESKGWLFKMKISDEKELDYLLSHAQYSKEICS